MDLQTMLKTQMQQVVYSNIQPIVALGQGEHSSELDQPQLRTNSEADQPQLETNLEPDQPQLGTSSEPNQLQLETSSEPDQPQLGTSSEPDQHQLGARPTSAGNNLEDERAQLGTSSEQEQPQLGTISTRSKTNHNSESARSPTNHSPEQTRSPTNSGSEPDQPYCSSELDQPQLGARPNISEPDQPQQEPACSRTNGSSEPDQPQLGTPIQYYYQRVFPPEDLWFHFSQSLLVGSKIVYIFFRLKFHLDLSTCYLHYIASAVEKKTKSSKSLKFWKRGKTKVKMFNTPRETNEPSEEDKVSNDKASKSKFNIFRKKKKTPVKPFKKEQDVGEKDTTKWHKVKLSAVVMPTPKSMYTKKQIVQFCFQSNKQG